MIEIAPKVGDVVHMRGHTVPMTVLSLIREGKDREAVCGWFTGAGEWSETNVPIAALEVDDAAPVRVQAEPEAPPPEPVAVWWPGSTPGGSYRAPRPEVQPDPEGEDTGQSSTDEQEDAGQTDHEAQEAHIGDVREA